MHISLIKIYITLFVFILVILQKLFHYFIKTTMIKMLKKTLLGLSIIFCMMLSACSTQSLPKQQMHNPMTQDKYQEQKTYTTLIIYYSDGYRSSLLDTLHSKNLEIIYDLTNMNMFAVKVLTSNLDKEMQELSTLPGVNHVQKDSRNMTTNSIAHL